LRELMPNCAFGPDSGMITPTLTAGASARTEEMMEGVASKAAVPESIARRFILTPPTEIFADIASSAISCFNG
jgi:hypothetical protein